MTRSPEAEKPTPRALLLHALNATLLSARQQLEAALAMLAALEAQADEVQHISGPPGPLPLEIANEAFARNDAVSARRVFGAMRERQQGGSDTTSEDEVPGSARAGS